MRPAPPPAPAAEPRARTRLAAARTGARSWRKAPGLPVPRAARRRARAGRIRALPARGPAAGAGAVLPPGGGAPPARPRRAAGVAPGGAPDRRGGSGGGRPGNLVARIRGAAPILPAYPEYPGAEPADGSPGRAP